MFFLPLRVPVPRNPSGALISPSTSPQDEGVNEKSGEGEAVVPLHENSTCREVYNYFFRLWTSGGLLNTDLDNDTNECASALKIIDKRITGRYLFSFPSEKELLTYLIVVAEIPSFPASLIATEIFNMKGQMLEDHLDGPNPRRQIFGINLFGFDNQKALNTFLEGRGYPNAGPVADKVFEMKGQMLEDHLDGDNSQKPIFDIHLFDFATEDELRQQLVIRGYPNAGTVAKKVFALKVLRLITLRDSLRKTLLKKDKVLVHKDFEIEVKQLQTNVRQAEPDLSAIMKAIAEDPLPLEAASAWNGPEIFRPPSLKAESVPFRSGQLFEAGLALRKDLHFPDEVIDKSLRSVRECSIVNLVAPSSSGKSGAVFRLLCEKYGFYMTCTSSLETTAMVYTTDWLAASLHKTLQTIDEVNLLLWGEHYAALAILSKLCSLLSKLRLSGRPDEETFLRWQVNGQTRASGDLFIKLVESCYHQCALEHLCSLISEALAEVMKHLGVKETPPFFIDEAQVFSGNDCLPTAVVTPQGNVLENAILSLLIPTLLVMAPAHSLQQHPCLITTGTGFSTPHLEIIQSASFEKSSRKLYQITGHSLIEEPEKAIQFLESVVTVPEELQKCIRSPEFQWAFPARRRFLTSCLIRWMEKAKDIAPSVPDAAAYFEIAAKVMEDRISVAVARLKKENKANYIRSMVIIWLCRFGEKDRQVSWMKSDDSRQIVASSICDYQTQAAPGTIVELTDDHNRSIRFDSREYFTQGVVKAIRKESSKEWRKNMTRVLSEILICNNSPENWERYFFMLLHINPISPKELIESSWASQALGGMDLDENKDPEPHWRTRAGAFLSSNLDIRVDGFLNGPGDVLAALRLISTTRSKEEAARIQRIQQLYAEALLVNIENRSDEQHLLASGEDHLLPYLFQEQLVHLLVGFAYHPSKNAHFDAILICDLGHFITDYRQRYGLLLMCCKALSSNDSQKIHKRICHNTNQVQPKFMYRKVKSSSVMSRLETPDWIPKMDNHANSTLALLIQEHAVLPCSFVALFNKELKLDFTKAAIQQYESAALQLAPTQRLMLGLEEVRVKYGIATVTEPKPSLTGSRKG